MFHEFYRIVVQKLFDAGVSRNVYCVNIDAVIATLLLKTVWPAYREGRIKDEASSYNVKWMKQFNFA